MNVVYTPVGSTVPFLTSDKFSSFIIGPVGCLSGDSEVLTPQGWVRMDAWNGQEVAEWEPETNAMAFRQPVAYVAKPCDELIHFENKHALSMVLSPEHRVPVLDWKGEFKVTTAEQLERKPSSNTIPINWVTSGDTLGMSDEEIRLWVAIAADGHYPVTGKQCFITVRKERKKERVRELLQNAGVPFNETVYDSRPTETKFTFPRPSHPKHFDERWWRASSRELNLLLDELDHWDGLHEHAEKRFSTARKDQAEIVQFAAHSCGRRATLRVETNEDKGWRPTYAVQISTWGSPKGKVKLRKDTTDIRRVPALNGMKYCFTTNTGFFIARHNGRIFCTGNSTKTTASLMKIAYEAKKVKACRDGIRRSRIAVIRNTRQMLWDTTIPDFLKWYPAGVAGDLLKTESKFLLRFDDTECEVLFRGLDDANDVRRLLSLQLTYGMIDEFAQVSPDIYNALTGRLGRYPDKTMNGVGPCDDNGKQIHKVWGASNPPDMATWWEEYLTNPPENTHVTIQPSGRSPEADWVQHLPDLYYENLCQGKDEDWVSVYVDGKFGASLQGKPVFRAFSVDAHVSKEEIKPIQGQPIIVGIDAGLTPAAVFGQVDYQGRVIVHDAITSDNMGALRFIRERLKPLIANKYSGYKLSVVIDPAATQRVQTDERTVMDMFKAEGFAIRPARTNSIAARIAAVDQFLTRTVDGKPSFLVNRVGCTDLIAALRGKYRYRVNTKGETDESPEKNAFSHVSDALQYLCLHADNGSTLGWNVTAQRREIKKVGYHYS